MKRFVWSGVYLTAAAAAAELAAAETVPFGMDTWLVRQRKLSENVTKLLTTAICCQGPRPTSLPAILAGSRATTVVDLGGGSGWVMSLLQCLGIAPSRYVVVDLPCVVEYFRLNPVEGVEYREIAELVRWGGTTVDVLYVNSALQYMEDNTELIGHIQHLRPGVLVIDEFLWTEGMDDWFTTQQNSDSPSVARFSSSSRLKSQIQENAMRLVWEGDYGAGHNGYEFPSMSNFPSHLAVSNAKTLVFVREA